MLYLSVFFFLFIYICECVSLKRFLNQEFLLHLAFISYLFTWYSSYFGPLYSSLNMHIHAVIMSTIIFSQENRALFFRIRFLIRLLIACSWKSGQKVHTNESVLPLAMAKWDECLVNCTKFTGFNYSQWVLNEIRKIGSSYCSSETIYYFIIS